MKIKIIKDYEVRPGRIWKAGINAEVLDDFAAAIIKGGFARELRIEKVKDPGGFEYEVETEVVDNSTTISRKVPKKTEE